MFNLFKNKQREQFDKDFYQLVDEYHQLVLKYKKQSDQNDDKDFVETINHYVSQYNELFWRLDKLELKIESTLKPRTTEQEVEKIDLVRTICRAQTKIVETTDHFKALKNAYLQGLEDGRNNKER